MLACALLLNGSADLPLTVYLSIDQDGGLSTLQLSLAVDEVRTIWSDARVDVTSGPYRDLFRRSADAAKAEISHPDEATISLRILRSSPPVKAGAERRLAWVTPGGTGRPAPMLLVSLPAVTEAVMGADALGRPVAKLTLDLRDRLIARAVGRVTAHELGHYLLGSGGHQDRGLMRATYSPSELVGAWLEPFKVPEAQRPIVRQEIAALARMQTAY